MKGALAGLVLLPMFFIVLLVMPLVFGGADPGGQVNPSSCAPGGGGSVELASARTATSAWGDFNAEQMTNAALIVSIGTERNIPARGQQIALMTAIDESQLIPQKQWGMPEDHPDTAWGLFQQTPAYGWGTREQVMDPTYATHTFYDVLVEVAGWEAMEPTLAAHAVQRNRDPYVYAQFWDQAGELLSHLGGEGASTVSTYCDSASSDGGGSGLLPNGAVESVGPVSPEELRANTDRFVANADAIWFNRCQNYAAQVHGRPNSGYPSANSAVATFRQAGVFHEANAIDGYAPPVGAWLYFATNHPYGHVVTYLGDGLVTGNDTWQSGHVGIGPFTDITEDVWNLTYLGWAAPWANTAGDVEHVAPGQPAPAGGQA